MFVFFGEMFCFVGIVEMNILVMCLMFGFVDSIGFIIGVG